MRIGFLSILSILSIILILGTAGCVAPPKEIVKPAAGETGGDSGQNIASETTVTPQIVAEATLYQTVPTPTMGYSEFVPPTPIPEDQVCLVDLSSFNWTFESNATAKKFDLKNPPLYINYSITKPFNVSGTKVYFNPDTPDKKTITVPYTYYSPYAYLDITVRDAISGNIYVEDGFSIKYGQKLNKTIRVQNPGDLLIEIRGNNVTPTVGIWAKPIGNLNSSINFSQLECRSQEYVKMLNQ